jgi:hypothetical protein
MLVLAVLLLLVLLLLLLVELKDIVMPLPEDGMILKISLESHDEEQGFI